MADLVPEHGVQPRTNCFSGLYEVRDTIYYNIVPRVVLSEGKLLCCCVRSTCAGPYGMKDDVQWMHMECLCCCSRHRI